MALNPALSFLRSFLQTRRKPFISVNWKGRRKELKSIVLKTTGCGEFLRERIRENGKLDAAFIYGSTAKGTIYFTGDFIDEMRGILEGAALKH